jgi:hypothetical protein
MYPALKAVLGAALVDFLSGEIGSVMKKAEEPKQEDDG